MQLIKLLAYAYLGVGVLYGLFLIRNRNTTLLQLPINILGGPILLVYIILATRSGKKMPY